MRTHNRKLWPLFLGDAVVGLLGLLVLRGTASGVACAVALFGLIGAAIYGLAGEDVNDGAGGIAGGAGW